MFFFKRSNKFFKRRFDVGNISLSKFNLSFVGIGEFGELGNNVFVKLKLG